MSHKPLLPKRHLRIRPTYTGLLLVSTFGVMTACSTDIGSGDATKEGGPAAPGGVDERDGTTRRVASAVGLENGVASNGLGVNGAAMNGLMVNGLKLNGVQLNGLQLNGLNVQNISYQSGSSNGVTLFGVSVSGVSASSLSLNGYNNGYSNGYSPNGYNNGYNNGYIPNGYVPNGYSNGYVPNGYSNGYVPNGYVPNGYNNGYSPNGYNNGYNNGYVPNGYVPNGYNNGYSNGYVPNGYNNGYVPNGYNNGYNNGYSNGYNGGAGFASVALGGMLDLREIKLNGATPTSAQQTAIRNYITQAVLCALPAGSSVQMLDFSGAPVTFNGSDGLDPAWATGPANMSASTNVGACILNRSTSAGLTGITTTSIGAQFDSLASYLVSCALPTGDSVTITDSAGSPKVLQGALGLAPEWKIGALSAAGQRRVSACLASRTNSQGKHVLLSIRGSGLDATAVEKGQFAREEGAFWGNLFAPVPYLRTCRSPGLDRGLAGRNCAQGGCGIPVVGDCSAVCTGRAADGTWTNCGDGDGNATADVLTTYLNLQNFSADNFASVIDGDGHVFYGTNQMNTLGLTFSLLGNVNEGNASFMGRETTTGTMYAWESNTTPNVMLGLNNLPLTDVLTFDQTSQAYLLTNGSVVTQTATLIPPYQEGGPARIVDIFGSSFSCTRVLRADGTLQLKIFAKQGFEPPRTRAGSTITDAVALGGSSDFPLYLTANGTVFSEDSDTPLITGVKTISRNGMTPIVVIKTNGSVWASDNPMTTAWSEIRRPDGSSFTNAVQAAESASNSRVKILDAGGTTYNAIRTTTPWSSAVDTTFVPYASCGNGICDVLEAATSCPSDCGPGAVSEVTFNRPTRMSSAGAAGDFGARAVDHDGWTAATTASEATPWWSVDLGANHTLTSVKLRPSGTLSNFVIEGALQASPNTWTTLKSVPGSISATTTYSVADTARFLRVRRLSSGTNQTLAIKEFSAVGRVLGPVAIWPLDEASGTIATSNLAGTFNGTPSSGIGYQRPPVASTGWGIDFTGAQSVSVAYAAALNPSSAFSVEGWFNTSGSTGADQDIITSRDTATKGYRLYVTSANTLAFALGTNTSTVTVSGGALASGVDYHAAATFDGTTAKLYLNGVLVGTNTVSGFAVNSTRPLRIGAGATEGAAQYFFKGTLDNVTVWNRALTSAEAAGRFEEGRKPGSTTGGGTCTPESDAAMCTRLSAACGSVTAADNCGTTRTITNCGTCAAGSTCSVNACVASNLLTNGGFEGSASPWVVSGSASWNASGANPYAGSGNASLVKDGINASGTVYQQVSLPVGAAAKALTFYLNVTTSDGTAKAYDFLYVELRSTSGTFLTTLTTYSNMNKSPSSPAYSQQTLAIPTTYNGQTVRIQFRGTSDASNGTTFRIDQVAVQ